MPSIEHFGVKECLHDQGVRRVYVRGTLPAWEIRPGAVHLAEHCWADALFGPSRPFPKFVSHNAYTSHCGAVAYVDCLSEDVHEVVAELQRRVANATLDIDVLERERNIVVTEAREWYSDDWTRAYAAWAADYYGVNTDVMGTEDDIKSITAEEAQRLFDVARTSDLHVIGGSYFEDMSDPLSLDGDKPLVNKNRKAFRFKKDPRLVEAGLCYVYVTLGSVLRSDDRLSARRLWTSLAAGLDTPLYVELREKRGLVYGVWTMFDCYGTPMIAFSTRPEQFQEASLAVAQVIDRVCTTPDLASVYGADVVERLTNAHQFNQCNRTTLQNMVWRMVDGYAGEYRGSAPALADALADTDAVKFFREWIGLGFNTKSTAVLSPVDP